MSGICLATTQFLQVGRLSLNKEFVDNRDFQVANQSQVDSHAHLGQQVHRLFTGDLLLPSLSYMGDGHVDEWAATLAKLTELDFELIDEKYDHNYDTYFRKSRVFQTHIR